MYFDEKLRTLREKMGLTIQAAAEKLYVTDAVLEALETGFKDPDRIEMRKITEFYNATEEELADDEPYVNAFSVLFQNSDMSESNLGSSLALAAGLMGGQKFCDPASEPEQTNTLMENIIIPVVKNIKLEMNNPVYEYLDKNIMTSDMPEGNYLAYNVPDDNMLGLGIYKNDVAIILLQKELLDKEIVAVLKNGSFTLKRVAKKSNSIILEAANPLIAPEMLSDKHYILGKLVETRKYF